MDSIEPAKRPNSIGTSTGRFASGARYAERHDGLLHGEEGRFEAMAYERAMFDRVGAYLLTSLERRARVELHAKRSGIEERRCDLVRRQQICVRAWSIGYEHICRPDRGFEIFHQSRP